MDEKNNGSRRSFDLPYWPAISVSIEVPDRSEDPDTITRIPSGMLKEFEDNPPGAPSNSPIIRPFAYFKYEGKVDKDNPLKLRVWYSPTAWEESAEAGGNQVPRIYIRKYKDGWDENWEEIVTNITPVRPGNDGSFGYLEVIYYKIPDPAIGGC